MVVLTSECPSSSCAVQFPPHENVLR